MFVCLFVCLYLFSFFNIIYIYIHIYIVLEGDTVILYGVRAFLSLTHACNDVCIYIYIYTHGGWNKFCMTFETDLYPLVATCPAGSCKISVIGKLRALLPVAAQC